MQEDNYYKPPYVYYSLNPGPKILGPENYFTFFTKEGRVHVQVVGTQKLPRRTFWRKYAKVLVKVID